MNNRPVRLTFIYPQQAGMLCFDLNFNKTVTNKSKRAETYRKENRNIYIHRPVEKICHTLN